MNKLTKTLFIALLIVLTRSDFFTPVNSVPDTVFSTPAVDDSRISITSTVNDPLPQPEPIASNQPEKIEAVLPVSSTVTTVVNPEINADIFLQKIEGHYGRCCHVLYVFSVDISGSMRPYQSSTQTALSNWKSWLVDRRAYGEDYWVSAHMFNTLSTIFNTNMIHRAPMHWMLPPASAYGGTNWNLAIKYLTARMSLRDHICYTMFTDQVPAYIYLDPAVVDAFATAYKRFQTYGCDFHFRIIDVRGLPYEYSKDLAARETQTLLKYPQTLAQLLTALAIDYTYVQPTSVKQIPRFYQCAPYL